MKKKHSHLLRQIYLEVPLELRNNLMVKEEKYKEIKKVMELALTDDDFPEIKKERYRNMKKAGILDEIEEVMDPVVARKIDDFVDGRVLEEVEKGNLPKIARTEIMKKLRKYETNNK